MPREGLTRPEEPNLSNRHIAQRARRAAERNAQSGQTQPTAKRSRLERILSSQVAHANALLLSPDEIIQPERARQMGACPSTEVGSSTKIGPSIEPNVHSQTELTAGHLQNSIVQNQPTAKRSRLERILSSQVAHANALLLSPDEIIQPERARQMGACPSTEAGSFTEIGPSTEPNVHSQTELTAGHLQNSIVQNHLHDDQHNLDNRNLSNMHLAQRARRARGKNAQTLRTQNVVEPSIAQRSTMSRRQIVQRARRPVREPQQNVQTNFSPIPEYSEYVSQTTKLEIVRAGPTKTTPRRGSKLCSPEFSATKMVTIPALPVTLYMPMMGSLPESCSGTPGDASPTEARTVSNHRDEAGAESPTGFKQPVWASQTITTSNHTSDQTKSYCGPNSLVHATAIAAGARIIPPKAAASLIKAIEARIRSAKTLPQPAFQYGCKLFTAESWTPRLCNSEEGCRASVSQLHEDCQVHSISSEDTRFQKPVELLDVFESHSVVVEAGQTQMELAEASGGS